MKWYIYDEHGDIEARTRIKYHLTAPQMADMIARKTAPNGQKKVIEDPEADMGDIQVSYTNWTKSDVDDHIRGELYTSGNSASRMWNAENRKEEEKLEGAKKIINKYYDDNEVFQIQFNLAPRTVALLISDEIDEKNKITKKYVEKKVNNELRIGGYNQAPYGIGDYVDESQVKEAEKKITELYDLDWLREEFDFEPKFKSKGKGWYDEPIRHSMAAKGMRTRWRE